MEATFFTLYITILEYLCQWLIYILNILDPENGSHILYAICYYSRIPVSMVTINGILNLLLNHKLHILGQENRSHILDTEHFNIILNILGPENGSHIL